MTYGKSGIWLFILLYDQAVARTCTGIHQNSSMVTAALVVSDFSLVFLCHTGFFSTARYNDENMKSEEGLTVIKATFGLDGFTSEEK